MVQILQEWCLENLGYEADLDSHDLRVRKDGTFKAEYIVIVKLRKSSDATKFVEEFPVF